MGRSRNESHRRRREKLVALGELSPATEARLVQAGSGLLASRGLRLICPLAEWGCISPMGNAQT